MNEIEYIDRFVDDLLDKRIVFDVSISLAGSNMIFHLSMTYIVLLHSI